MSDLDLSVFDRLDFDPFDSEQPSPPGGPPCAGHEAHDGTCIFSQSSQQLLRCLYRMHGRDGSDPLPDCSVCQFWSAKDFKNYRARLKRVVKKCIFSPCYSSTLADLLARMQVTYGSGSSTSSPLDVLPPSGRRSSVIHPPPHAGIGLSAPSNQFRQSGSSATYPGLAFSRGAPSPPQVEVHSPQDEPPPKSRFTLVDWASQFAPSMLVDPPPNTNNPASGAYGFEEAPSNPFPQRIRADESLCGAFFRGVNYHIRSEPAQLEALLQALPSSPLGTPSPPLSPLPAGAYHYGPHAATMPTFLSSSCLGSVRSGFHKFSQPSISRDLQSRWAAVSRTFLYLQEISALNSLLFKHPEIDSVSRNDIFWQQRQMLLGAAHTLGSLGHLPMRDARRQYIDAMGRYASSSFSVEPFTLTSPLGPDGHHLWTQGPPDMAVAVNILEERTVASSSRQSDNRLYRGGGRKPSSGPRGQHRRSPYPRPRNLPPQPAPQASASNSRYSNQSAGNSRNSRQQQSSQRGSLRGSRGKRRF